MPVKNPALTMHDQAACPICGAVGEKFEEYAGILTSNLLELTIFERLDVHRCRSCDHVFAASRSVNLGILKKYYESEFSPNRVSIVQWLRTIRTAFADRVDQRARTQVALVRRFLAETPERILEVGAGYAGFSRCIRRELQSAVALDVAEPSRSVDHFYRLCRIHRRAETFEEVDVPKDTYSIIHASHWLEHTPDLSGTLERLHRLLAVGGLVSIEVPNCDADYWSVRHFPSVPHFQFFTPQSIRAAFEEHGFEVNYVGTCGPWNKDDPGLLPRDCLKVIDVAQAKAYDAARLARTGRQEVGSLGEYSPTGRAYLRLIATK